jgi:wobble nucleotide-excising tRNase
VEQTVTSINEKIRVYNAQIEQATRKIASLKATLIAEDLQSLQEEIQRVIATQKRYQQETVDLVAQWENAGTEKARLEEGKSKIRAQIDELMRATLEQYQVAINKTLKSMGAEFRIEGVKPSYVGTGEPRTEYALNIRGQSVKLGTREDLGAGPCFGTTLSEGDKRTLAFAFFISRVQADANLARKVVVVDDPVCSLDGFRKYQTRKLLCGMAANKCSQLIVLSHDPYFLRDLKDALADLKPTPVTPSVLMLQREQQGYCAFAVCDLDDVCRSPYYRHHRLVSEYVDGVSHADPREVAKAIRPLLEGYYHRRFPSVIPRRKRLGDIIQLVGAAKAPSPLANLKPVLQKIKEVNEYAREFHHDANPQADTAPVLDAELLPFARKALELIYENG